MELVALANTFSTVRLHASSWLLSNRNYWDDVCL